ncbi:type I-F CRISPR-associated protein Csy3 [Aeromonas hydrophila]|uniref:type I-F CRISPR-associated protein Csy3 n=2 Tax=Aeromonas hydrophila TaxID=644 RepID=UPI001A8F4016|nr:type I-F CRISPR-associated protein Csy3 [Aeromonas hydrophila]MBQ4666499.1 type I-F CRISPR-associated protein Csy3 [Aeromonas hydrophila]MBQ4715138.1 type I-F CRISPR-associated protein Csy3 [Aeromonas hydrophila]MBW3823554.1 type I-F CRISPR-associated protein Csy3 [Aeromonas hydrophila]MBW5268215.1 type I-F CRISPR-associated protein Csy3 [Aeromonas hydrophila]QSR60049.1 type I-F CRISPR-associated protein Csy3 [Aeromonas hydrophila]
MGTQTWVNFMELCTHLSYIRSLSPGKAVFFYKTETSDFVPLRIDVTKISGQKCGYTEGFEANLRPKNIERYELAYSNPQIIEVCYVPPNVDEIYCRFSLRVEANSIQPYVCSDPEVFCVMVRLAKIYQELGGYHELARRYSSNMLMGTWLWRNQCTQGTDIKIKTSLGSTYHIPDARRLSWSGEWPDSEQKQLEQLAYEMANALSEPKRFWFADVTAALKTGFCQEVFPSQKFTEQVEEYGVASRQLATTECSNGQLAACINPQKIGAALQQVDDWWADDADLALRVHEYGADHEALTTMRHPTTGLDFYHLLAKADQFASDLDSHQGGLTELPREIHYLMSVLVKGGLFQRGKGR